MTTKSILFGASNPTAYDGSVMLPDDDGIFPGTIWSFRPAHPVYGLSAAPTDGQVIKNAAWRQFAALTGRDSSDEADCHGTYHLGSDIGGTKWKQELTAKGGLHSIVTQSAGSTANTYGYAKIPDAVKTYIRDNSRLGGSSTTDTGQVWNTSVNHRFAMTALITMTRIYRTDSGKTGGGVIFAGLVKDADADNVPTLGSMTGLANTPAYPVTGIENTGQSTTSATLIGAHSYPVLPMTVDVPVLRWMAMRGWFNTYPASISEFMGVCGAGHLPGQAGANLLNASMSYVLYGWDIIDTWAQNAYPQGNRLSNLGSVDYSHTGGDIYGIRNKMAAWKNRVTSVGGQFYGDTLPTAPSSIP